MLAITGYIYNNTVTAVYENDPSIAVRNRQVYNRTLEIARGVSNVIKINIKNAEQKLFSPASTSFVFYIIDDYINEEPSTVITANATATSTTGVYTVTLAPADLINLDRNDYNWALKAVAINGTETAVFVNDNWGISGQLRINQQAYPTTAVDTLDLGSIDDATTSVIYDFGTIQ